jgi:23S rRNA (cytidine2498-2'-O)-methyltransferase
MPKSTPFIFFTCQVGAETALKSELARECPTWRLAFSRPGFLTFKVPPDVDLPDDVGQSLIFARTCGFCLGKVEGNTEAERAQSVWNLIGAVPVTVLHVWPRDRLTPGFRDYEPGQTPESKNIELAIRAAGNACSPPYPAAQPPTGAKSSRARRSVEEKQAPLAADVVIVEKGEWWVGYHRAKSLASSWPGGFLKVEMPADAVSRAWLKLHEAILWSGFRLHGGQKCVEIGSAPGGASQYLLDGGLDVIGVDPAQMDPAVLANPHFKHIRKRSKEVPRREFVGVDWLTADVNLPPNYTLDAVKSIVSHPGVKFKGLLLTLKLVEWSLADEIPKYIARLRACGFRTVRARQLHHNRQEICVAASGYRTKSV